MLDWLLFFYDRLLDFIGGGSVRQTRRLAKRIEGTLARMRGVESDLVALQDKKRVAQTLSVLRRLIAMNEFMLDSARSRVFEEESFIAASKVLRTGLRTSGFAEVERRVKEDYERKLAEIEALVSPCAACGKLTQEGAAAGCPECVARDED